MPSFIDRNTGEIISVPGTPWPTDPAEYDRRIETVWKLAGDMISDEDAISWTRELRRRRDLAVAAASGSPTGEKNT